MEANNEMNVNAQLDLLAPEPGWQPDLNGALARFEKQRSRSFPTLFLFAALAGCLCLAAVLEFRGVAASDRILKDRQAAPDFALRGAPGRLTPLFCLKT